jgi:hypothetical protein
MRLLGDYVRRPDLRLDLFAEEVQEYLNSFLCGEEPG